MGVYCTRLLSDEEVEKIINLVRHGYTDYNDVPHKPNPQIATILCLQANLGCRINDIVNMRVENVVFDGEAWRLNLIEQKTGKARPFLVPTPVKGVIDRWCEKHRITTGRLFSITAQAVWKQLRNVTSYLGYTNVSAHSFRKRAAMNVYETSGKDIALTSQFLNHSSSATSLLYLKRSSKQMDDVISKIALIV